MSSTVLEVVKKLNPTHLGEVIKQTNKKKIEPKALKVNSSIQHDPFNSSPCELTGTDDVKALPNSEGRCTL